MEQFQKSSKWHPAELNMLYSDALICFFTTLHTYSLIWFTTGTNMEMFPVSWDEIITSSNPYTWAPPPLSFWMISSPSGRRRFCIFFHHELGAPTLTSKHTAIFLKSDFKVTVPIRFHQNFLTIKFQLATCYPYSPNFRSSRVPNTRLAAGRTCFAQIAHTDVLGSDLSFNATIATGFWWRASRSLWFFTCCKSMLYHTFSHCASEPTCMIYL